MSIYLSDGISLLVGSGYGTGLFELGLHCGILVGEFLDGQRFCLVVGQTEITQKIALTISTIDVKTMVHSIIIGLGLSLSLIFFFSKNILDSQWFLRSI